MKVFILTPDKTIYEGEAISIQVKSMNASFQLLDQHISMLAILKEVDIKLDQSIYHIENGMLEVKNGMVKILVNY